MKKFLIVMTVILMSATIISCSKQQNISELISLRNQYQNEYNLLQAEWKLRMFKEFGYVDEAYTFFATFEEAQREKVCKDSIEILNIEIERYKNIK